MYQYLSELTGGEMEKFEKKKAVALISGGLDSALAAVIIKRQGIEVHGLHFTHAFNSSLESYLIHAKDRRSVLTTQPTVNFFSEFDDKYARELKSVMEQVGIPIHVEQMTERIISLLRNPRYGFGKNLNPCVDCRIMQFQFAKLFMEKIGADFLVTGEVVGQRPMSQKRDTIKLIEKHSGLNGLIVRPLSAKLLAQTIPEKEGWVKREMMYDISGRSRKMQKMLAEIFEIRDYPESGGGCRLTYEGFARKMKDLVDHKNPDGNDTYLLQVGRHFRTSKYGKAIVGKDKKDNETLKKFAREGDVLFEVFDGHGPTVLLRDGTSDLDTVLAACLCVSHANLEGQAYKPVRSWDHGSNRMRIRQVAPLDAEQIEKMRI
jgi:tRNA-uridine 2-sulfurtransferase